MAKEGPHVCEYTDANHLKSGQRNRHAKVNVQYHGHCFRKRADRQQIQNHFSQIVEHQAAILDGDKHRVKTVVHEDYLSGLHRHFTVTAHGNANIGGFERGRVIHAVPSDGHDVLPLFELLDHSMLLGGSGARKHDFLVFDNDRPVGFGREFGQVFAR